MYTVCRRIVGSIHRSVGIGVARTYLYRIGRPERWSVNDTRDSIAGCQSLSADGVKNLLEIGPFDVNEGLRRLGRGDLCYTVSLDTGLLAHYSWVQRSGSHPITQAGLLSVPVEAGDFWIYNCRTVDWARGRGIYAAVLKRIVNDQFAQGSSTAWIYTSNDNIPSQRGIERAGFERVETLAALRLGRRYFHTGKRFQR